MEIDGLGELSDDLEELADEIAEIRQGVPQAVDKAVEDATEELHNEMVSKINQLADNPSGNLASSIEHDQLESAQASGSARWAVGPTADYAKHVEYGTGTRGQPSHASGDEYYITNKETSMGEIREKMINSRGDEGLGELEDVPAITIDGDQYLYAKHPGSRPTPFWRNAIAEFENKRRLIEHLESQTSHLFVAARIK